MEDEDLNNKQGSVPSVPSVSKVEGNLPTPKKTYRNSHDDQQTSLDSDSRSLQEIQKMRLVFPQYRINLPLHNLSFPSYVPWEAIMNLPRPGPLGIRTFKEGPQFVLSDYQVNYLNFNSEWINLQEYKQQQNQNFSQNRVHFMNQYKQMECRLYESMRSITQLAQFDVKVTEQLIKSITNNLFTQIMQENRQRSEQIDIMVTQPLKICAIDTILSILQKITEKEFLVEEIKETQVNQLTPYVNLSFKRRGQSSLTPSDLLKLTKQKLNEYDYIIIQQEWGNVLLIFVDVIGMLKIAPVDNKFQKINVMNKASVIKFQINFDGSALDSIKKYYQDMNQFLEYHQLVNFFINFLAILTKANLLDNEITRRQIFIMIAAFYMEFKFPFLNELLTDSEILIDMIQFYGGKFCIEKTLIDIQSSPSKFVSKKHHIRYNLRTMGGLAIKDPEAKYVIFSLANTLKVFSWMQGLLQKIHDLKMKIISHIRNQIPFASDFNHLTTLVCEKVRSQTNFLILKGQLQYS